MGNVSYLVPSIHPMIKVAPAGVPIHTPDFAGFAITEAKIRAGGKLKCNATLTFRHTPFPNPDLRGHMETMAKRIGFPQQAIAHG